VLTVSVCVGSSCYVRGSDQVAETLETLIAQQELEEEVALIGSFCMDACSMGVSVRVGDRVFRGIRPESVERVFAEELLPVIRQQLAAVGSKGRVAEGA